MIIFLILLTLMLDLRVTYCKEKLETYHQQSFEMFNNWLLKKLGNFGKKIHTIFATKDFCYYFRDVTKHS